MKYISVTSLLLLICGLASAQDRFFLQTSSKRDAWYVDMRNKSAVAYKMGIYYDKAGTAPAILSADTLLLQPDGSYTGTYTKIMRENNAFVLYTNSRKRNKHRLGKVENEGAATTRLNNAWYVGQYVKMTDTLNKSYPFTHHSFRGGFYTWQTLSYKEMDYLEFRTVAGRQLKAFEDSVRNVHNGFMATTNYITQHLSTIAYDTLKHHITRLPLLQQYEGIGWYRGAMMKEVARQRPEYFWKLTRDFPDNRNLVFWTVRQDKTIMRGLNAVAGYDDMKKEFDRAKKEDRKAATMGTISIIAGAALLGVIAVALF